MEAGDLRLLFRLLHSLLCARVSDLDATQTALCPVIDSCVRAMLKDKK